MNYFELLGLCCSKNGSLPSLGCSTATQSHGNTRIVSSQTSNKSISSCKWILPHKRNDEYSAWELHDLNFSPAILHCLSTHSTGCILPSKVCFFLDLAAIWNLWSLSWSNPFCSWKCFFLWIRFPLCEHHIAIWPNSNAKFPKDTGRKLTNSQQAGGCLWARTVCFFPGRNLLVKVGICFLVLID